MIKIRKHHNIRSCSNLLDKIWISNKTLNWTLSHNLCYHASKLDSFLKGMVLETDAIVLKYKLNLTSLPPNLFSCSYCNSKWNFLLSMIFSNFSFMPTTLKCEVDWNVFTSLYAINKYVWMNTSIRLIQRDRRVKKYEFIAWKIIISFVNFGHINICILQMHKYHINELYLSIRSDDLEY